MDAVPRYRVEPGYEFDTVTLTVTRREQREKHGFSDIPESVYGDRADPGFLARYPIKVIGGALFACHPDRGYVHTVQRIRQLAPVALDEPIIVKGRFTDVVDHPRGWMMHAEFDYRRANGEPVLVVNPQALMADRTRMPPPGEKRPAAAPVEPEGTWEKVGFKQCTPEKVLGYCGDTDNKIHTDPEYARKFGMRAPITAGNQMVNYLLEAAAKDGLQDRMDVTIRFRRPVFWDDALDLVGRREGGRLAEIRALKADGKVACDLVVNG